MAGFLDTLKTIAEIGIMSDMEREKRNKLDYEKRSKKQDQELEAQSPWQQLLAKEYQRENPGASLEGTPFEQSARNVTGQPVGGGVDYTQDMTLSTPTSTVGIGSKGFEMNKPKNPKEFIFQRIQEKKARGIKLNKGEERFFNEYLGIDENKTSAEELTKDDRINIYKVAVRIAENNEEQINEENIQKYMDIAMRQIFPNIEDKEKAVDLVSDTLNASMSGFKREKQEYKVGQTITTPKGKVKIVGFDDDGTPMIERTK